MWVSRPHSTSSLSSIRTMISQKMGSSRTPLPVKNHSVPKIRKIWAHLTNSRGKNRHWAKKTRTCSSRMCSPHSTTSFTWLMQAARSLSAVLRILSTILPNLTGNSGLNTPMSRCIKDWHRMMNGIKLQLCAHLRAYSKHLNLKLKKRGSHCINWSSSFSQS